MVVLCLSTGDGWSMGSARWLWSTLVGAIEGWPCAAMGLGFGMMGVFFFEGKKRKTQQKETR